VTHGDGPVIQVLGHLEVAARPGGVRLGRLETVVLAVLAADIGRTVSAERIIR